MDINKIESNWKTYESLLRRLDDDSLDNMLSEMSERICVCPASMKLDQYGCLPGGLVQHALDVTATMRVFNDAHSLGLPVTSILKVGLLHDIGKVGDLQNDYFLPQESDWHREKLGQMYRYNEEIQKMSISHRSLFLLQNFGVKISEEEWIAIQLSQGSHFEENRFYARSEPTLALILQQAKSLSIHKS